MSSTLLAQSLRSADGDLEGARAIAHLQEITLVGDGSLGVLLNCFGDDINKCLFRHSARVKGAPILALMRSVVPPGLST